MKITIKTESHPDIVSSPVICGISIDGVMSQNDVRDALSEIDKFTDMFFDKQINKSGNEPDPHDFCANAATAKTCKGTAEQLAQRAKQEVHALKNLAVLGGDETADKKAGRIYDLIDQIVACGVSEKRYGNSCIPDPNAQPIDLATVAEIAQLRKENAALKDWNDELSSRVHSMQNTIMELQQTVEYLNPTFSNIRAGESPNVHFQRVATPLIKYLAENHHPHMQATVTSTSANLWEGHISLPNIHDFLDHND